MRTLLERIEAKTKTGITLRVLSGGQDPTAAHSAAVPANPKYYDIDPNVGIPVGKTVERDGLRLHRFASRDAGTPGRTALMQLLQS